MEESNVHDSILAELLKPVNPLIVIRWRLALRLGKKMEIGEMMDLSDNFSVPIELDQFEVFPWNNNFETGIENIDAQHMQLVKLLNELARTLVYGEAIVVNSTFEELARYADQHFADEEAIWEEYLGDDHWFSSHQNSHASFLPMVNELKEKNANKPLVDVVECLVRFLIRWLAFHIIDSDKRLAMTVQSLLSGSSIEEAKTQVEKRMSGSLRTLIETILKMYDNLSSSAIAMLRERVARIKVEEELKKTTKELKVLEGILHICAHCKKIRNNNGEWDQLEAFIDSHSEARFSHSICPSCSKEHYPGI